MLNNPIINDVSMGDDLYFATPGRRVAEMDDLELTPVCEYCGVVLPRGKGKPIR
jgi:hypothetical protein